MHKIKSINRITYSISNIYNNPGVKLHDDEYDVIVYNVHTNKEYKFNLWVSIKDTPIDKLEGLFRHAIVDNVETKLPITYFGENWIYNMEEAYKMFIKECMNRNF